MTIRHPKLLRRLPMFRPSLGRGLFRPIATPRCVLRLGAMRDAPEFARQAQDMGVAQWMLNFPSPFPQALVQQRFRDSWERLAKGHAVSLVAIDRSNGRFVGGVALNNINALPEPELAYWVRTDLWGQGYGLEITTAMLNYAFDIRQDIRIRASVMPGNQASSRLLERLGFLPTGQEQVWAEPYAPSIGMMPEAITHHLSQDGDPRVAVMLDKWLLPHNHWRARA